MWGFDQLDFVRDQVRGLPGIKQKPSGGIGKFASRARYAVGLCVREKEILVFAVLQWTAVALGYVLWLQIIYWIPESIWRSAAESDGTSLADWILIGWGFVCVGVAAYPIGILTGCMGAAHFLHRQGLESTVAACMRQVVPQRSALWAFHWIDGWVTVNQILERLPKKGSRRTPAERAASEALYYAWKLGIAGVLPSILTGKGLIEAGKSSFAFVKENLAEVAALRAGYSAVCWIVGIGSYLGALFLFSALELAPGKDDLYGHMFEFFFWAGGPVLAAAAVVMLFLRPLYVLAMCDLYSDHIAKKIALGKNVR